MVLARAGRQVPGPGQPENRLPLRRGQHRRLSGSQTGAMVAWPRRAAIDEPLCREERAIARRLRLIPRVDGSSSHADLTPLLLRRLDMAEREQEREVVGDLERSTDHQR